MKLFIDESGQTGCIKLDKNDNLPFLKQPIFTNGGVLVDEIDEKELISKYTKFKNKFGFNGEVKGSDLTTRKNNDALIYFIENILNEKNFFINIYDKRFYIASLLCTSLLGHIAKKSEPILVYNLISSLSFQNDDFYIKYLSFVENVNEKTLEEYLHFLINYDYKYLVDDYNGIKIIANQIVKDKNINLFVDDFMTYGWYDDEEKNNVINLNCLAELVFMIKKKRCLSNEDLCIIHDRITEFEKTLCLELEQHSIKIDFNNDENEDKKTLLEIADNISSIFTHFFNKVKSFQFKRAMFEEDNKWNLIIMSKIVRKISNLNIKYTISIPDWSALLAIVKIFENNDITSKNMYVFNYYYEVYQAKIIQEIQIHSSLFDQVERIMKE